MTNIESNDAGWAPGPLAADALPDDPLRPESTVGTPGTVLAAARDYLARGLSIVPQRTGDKKPCVRWKEFQQRRPTAVELTDWYTHQFPDAGVAVVLGPVSNLFVIDVDGPEAHAALVAHLGIEPPAPKVFSGSAQPNRYHLFFRHPAVATRAKFTPWHRTLEFRGHGGIVILPPSRHKSGTRYTWAPGRSLDDLPLPEVPALVLAALTERAAGQVTGEPPTGSTALPAAPPDVLTRAGAYLAQLPPAIEGQGGDRQTFVAACRLVLGFGLSPSDALPLLRGYNEHCQPPWPDDELVRKLQAAADLLGPRGTLLTPGTRGENPLGQPAAATNTTSPPSAGRDPFVGSVPDFVLADWHRAQPRFGPVDPDGRRRPGRPRISGGFLWAIHLAVIQQRSATVVLPDVLLGQVFWGGDRTRWPANWRQRLLAELLRYTGGPESPFQAVTLDNDDPGNRCTARCPMFGSARRHRHFHVAIRSAADVEPTDYHDDGGLPNEDAWLDHVFLGVLELYAVGADGDGPFYDFTARTQEADWDAATYQALTARLRRFRSAGRLVSVYLPLRLFGLSPRAGLSFAQRRLLLAVHRELTRASQSKRIDKASIVVAGRPVTGSAALTIDHYPGLSDGRRYVGFNGNGGARRRRLHGRGYRLLGSGGWVARARYHRFDESTDPWPSVRSFFNDLRAVAVRFGLVVAGRHGRTGEWLGLTELRERIRSIAGRDWVGRCTLRIYTDEDYLNRWRSVLAEAMGFAAIPDRDQEHHAETDPAASPITLLAYLGQAGVRQTDLAHDLGMSKSLLSRYLSGRKAWTPRWHDRIHNWIRQRETGGPR